MCQASTFLLLDLLLFLHSAATLYLDPSLHPNSLQPVPQTAVATLTAHARDQVDPQVVFALLAAQAADCRVPHAAVRITGAAIGAERVLQQLALRRAGVAATAAGCVAAGAAGAYAAHICTQKCS